MILYIVGNISRKRFMEIDTETRDKIIETHTDIKHICTELESGRKQFKQLDTRIRRIELWFLPLVTMIGLFAHKIWTIFKL